MSESDSTELRTAEGRFARHHTLNESFFEQWSADMAWVLGYICADGCVTRYQVTFSCKAEDRELLDFVQAATGASSPIRIVPASAGRIGRGPVARLSISSRKMVQQLGNLHGVCSRKSTGNPPIPDVPNEYLADFFRGVFDGDGTFHMRPTTPYQASVSVVGTELFLTQLRDRMCEVYGLNKPSVRRVKAIWDVRWTNKAAHLKLFTVMYPEGARLYLRRKQASFATAMACMPHPHCRIDKKLQPPRDYNP